MRYHEPRAFQTFPMRAEKVPTGCTSGETILIALLEAIVDRLADILERASRDIDRHLARHLPSDREEGVEARPRFPAILQQIGRKEDLASNMRDSLSAAAPVRLPCQCRRPGEDGKDMRARVKTLWRDVLSLTDHASFLSQKITFLLDATLGMINIEQNAIIKIFSVAAVVFLPPTLVASIYGMNFDIMPELKWMLGYPFALGLMVLSAILPFCFFKRRGWL